MATYEIIYDYCGEEYGCTEEFEGSWTDLQAYIKAMRREGCYNITATCISDPDEDPEPTVDQRHFLLPDLLAANM